MAPLRALQNFIPILVLTVSLEEMAVKRCGDSAGRLAAGRGARILLCALLSGTAALTHTPTANAFELFGFRLFGSGEEDDDIVDPLHYTVTLTVEGDDEDLKKTLDKASSLVQDVKRPVSGSLGLLAKAALRRGATGGGALCEGPLRRRRRHRDRRTVARRASRRTPISAPGRCR